MQWNDVRHNDFTTNLGNDWVALDQNHNPIARATDEASIHTAAPDAAGYLQGPVVKDVFDHDGNGKPGGSLPRDAAGGDEPAYEEPNDLAPTAENQPDLPDEDPDDGDNADDALAESVTHDNKVAAAKGTTAGRDKAKHGKTGHATHKK